MKKKIFIFLLASVLILCLPLCFALADSGCEHEYSDDGDCTTSVYCKLCGVEIVMATSHNYSTSLGFEFIDDNFMLGGTRRAKCSNEGCTSEIDEKIPPFAQGLGYSIIEREHTNATVATIISTYIFEGNLMRSYCDFLSDEAGKEIKLEYGFIGYVERYLHSAPIRDDKTSNSSVIRANFTGVNGISDISIPNIFGSAYDENIILTAYVIIGDDVFYIQSDKPTTDYTTLVPVTCNKILDKLEKNP